MSELIVAGQSASDKVALIRGPYRYGPYEYLYVNAQRIFACVHACEGIPTEALEAGVIRDLINAATRYLQITTRDTDDDPYCWAEEEFARDKLREVLAKVWGVRRGQVAPHRRGDHAGYEGGDTHA